MGFSMPLFTTRTPCFHYYAIIAMCTDFHTWMQRCTTEWVIRSARQEHANREKERTDRFARTTVITLDSGPRFSQVVSRLYSHLPLGYCSVSVRLFALE